MVRVSWQDHIVASLFKLISCLDNIVFQFLRGLATGQSPLVRYKIISVINYQQCLSHHTPSFLFSKSQSTSQAKLMLLLVTIFLLVLVESDIIVKHFNLIIRKVDVLNVGFFVC